MKISFKTILRMDYSKVSSKPLFFILGNFVYLGASVLLYNFFLL